MDDATPERWLPVVGWEGLYEVSDRGRVRSLPRLSVQRNRWYGGQVIKPVRGNQYGHLAVSLQTIGRRQKSYLIHRLVLEAFAGPCPEGQQARHGPGGPADNRWPENLRWGTPIENAADKVRDGTVINGERNHQAKLTEESVRAIRERWAAGGETLEALGAAYGVAVTTIHHVVCRRTWRHVP